MKFTAKRDVIADAIVWASRSLPTKSTNPLLTGLHLVADKSDLVISGFDADVSARVTVEANIEKPGTVLVPGRLLADIVRSLPASDVSFVVDGQRAVITSGKSSFTIPTMPVVDYPPLPAMPQASGTVTGADLAAAVTQVAVAASRDESLPAFSGIKVDIEGNVMTLVATDRYRLAIRELIWNPSNTSISTHALIPAKFFSESAKSLVNTTDVSLALSTGNDGIVGIEGTGRQTTSRTIAADFPKYKTLLPSQSTSVVQVKASALVEAVKRVALVLDREQPIRLDFLASEVKVVAGGNSGELAAAEESVECTLNGEEISIAFNPHFLIDGLTSIDAQVAVISMTQPSKPAVIVGAADIDGETDEDYKYLLMPIRAQ